jgi:hypothetical protein
MKWSYSFVKIGNKYHICEVYYDEKGKPNNRYAIVDKDFTINGKPLPQWVLKDLAYPLLELKNIK